MRGHPLLIVQSVFVIRRWTFDVQRSTFKPLAAAEWALPTNPSGTSDWCHGIPATDFPPPKLRSPFNFAASDVMGGTKIRLPGPLWIAIVPTILVGAGIGLRFGIEA
jgi:hypothetical protein